MVHRSNISDNWPGTILRSASPKAGRRTWAVVSDVWSVSKGCFWHSNYFSWPVMQYKQERTSQHVVGKWLMTVSSFLSPALAEPIHLQGEHATLLSQRIVASAAACLCQIIPLEEFGVHFLPQSKTTKNTKHQLATDSSQNSLWKIANNESMWSVALHYGRLSSAGVAIQIIGMHCSWRAE